MATQAGLSALHLSGRYVVFPAPSFFWYLPVAAVHLKASTAFVFRSGLEPILDDLSRASVHIVGMVASHED